MVLSLLLKTDFLILVPRPMLTNTVSGATGTLYAGSRLINLNQALMEVGIVNNVIVISRWFDPMWS